MTLGQVVLDVLNSYCAVEKKNQTCLLTSLGKKQVYMEVCDDEQYLGRAAGMAIFISQVQLFAVKPCKLCYRQNPTKLVSFKAFWSHCCYCSAEQQLWILQQYKCNLRMYQMPQRRVLKELATHSVTWETWLWENRKLSVLSCSQKSLSLKCHIFIDWVVTDCIITNQIKMCPNLPLSHRNMFLPMAILDYLMLWGFISVVPPIENAYQPKNL